MREYVDKLFDETSKVQKKRKRTYSNKIVSGKVPSNAPRWTLAGYNGPIKEAVEKACRQRSATSLEYQEEEN